MTPAYDVKETTVQVGRQGFPTDLFIVHETVGTYPGDLNWLVGSGQVSVTWYIRRDGKLWCLSSKSLATAHAGAGSWQGDGAQSRKIDGSSWGELNLRSEGVELEGPNDGTPVTAAQLSTLRDLVLWRCQVLGIRPDRVIRHRDMAPDRKTDPRGVDWMSFTASLWPNHTLVGRAPSCSYDGFVSVLDKWSSPALPEAQAMWDGMIKYGIDPAFGVAVFEHESSCGTAGKAVTTKNMGNMRRGMGRESGQALGFAQYKNWSDSAEDWANAIRHRYFDVWGLYTVERILPTYAPDTDGNAPLSYIAAVLERISRLSTGQSAQVAVGGLAGRDWACSQEFKSFYDKNGGLLVFGYPTSSQYEGLDSDGETCQYMRFENLWLKKKPSMPESWRLRPCSLQEIAHLAAVGTPQ